MCGDLYPACTEDMLQAQQCFCTLFQHEWRQMGLKMQSEIYWSIDMVKI